MYFCGKKNVPSYERKTEEKEIRVGGLWGLQLLRVDDLEKMVARFVVNSAKVLCALGTFPITITVAMRRA